MPFNHQVIQLISDFKLNIEGNVVFLKIVFDTWSDH